MADVRTGTLRERVDIYETVDIDTEFGGTESMNVLYWQTFANVSPLRSSKSLSGNQEALNNGYSITVRYRKDKEVTKRLKMLYRGKWLNLTSLINDDILKEYVSFVGTYHETSGGGPVIINTLEAPDDKPVIIDSNG